LLGIIEDELERPPLELCGVAIPTFDSDPVEGV
jgi:hypothetical protein